ncbi:DNA ligase [Vibrio sp. S11_S32]|uniref:DNA ligase n=1 Tax=Vibrio sp. S11_S32 TaxID=2720225 RepID=UPI00168079A7|nr:DNA ligase [Vibrio sp. S11_S32]MBD1575583.1 DNA ligase [Vibrio sp. S11_S32]
MRRYSTFTVIGSACLTLSFSADANLESASSLSNNSAWGHISLPLANDFQQDADISQYWYSEKLDGIRAFWDGRQLFTRNGMPIMAPTWFTKGFPDIALDGELWAGRGQFSQVQRTVLDKSPNQPDWRFIRFMAFDVADPKMSFEYRYHQLKKLISQSNSEYLELVQQKPINSQDFLYQNLDSVEALKGEGIMLRKLDSFYTAGRSDDLLKLKSFQDDEAIVIGYKKGKGRNLGSVGSLYVEWKQGKRFYLGSGLSDQQRRDPPALGEKVTFRFNGYTSSGLPRFARFIQVRNDAI